jgi:hypothetical protein
MEDRKEVEEGGTEEEESGRIQVNIYVMSMWRMNSCEHRRMKVIVG